MPAIEAVTRMTPPPTPSGPCFFMGERGVLHAQEHRADRAPRRCSPNPSTAGLGDRPEGAADAGVQIGDVETAETFLGLGDHGGHIDFLRDVAAHEGEHCQPHDRSPWQPPGLRAVGLVEVGHHDLRAIGQEAHDGGAAHAACPAGDDGHLACQSLSSSISLLRSPWCLLAPATASL